MKIRKCRGNNINPIGKVVEDINAGDMVEYVPIDFKEEEDDDEYDNHNDSDLDL